MVYCCCVLQVYSCNKKPGVKYCKSRRTVYCILYLYISVLTYVVDYWWYSSALSVAYANIDCYLFTSALLYVRVGACGVSPGITILMPLDITSVAAMCLLLMDVVPRSVPHSRHFLAVSAVSFYPTRLAFSFAEFIYVRLRHWLGSLSFYHPYT